MADEESKFSTEIPILDGVEDRAYYGRSSSTISNITDIRYDEEQPLAALICGKDQVRNITIQDFTCGPPEGLAENDYVYYFLFEFCK